MRVPRAQMILSSFLSSLQGLANLSMSPGVLPTTSENSGSPQARTHTLNFSPILPTSLLFSKQDRVFDGNFYYVFTIINTEKIWKRQKKW